MVGPARYLLGVASLLIVGGALGWAAVAIRRRYAPAWSGAIARLAEAVIALTLLTAELETLGTLRLFRLVPIVVVAVLIGVVATRVGAGRRPGAGRAPWRVSAWAVTAGIVGLAVAAEWAGPTFASFDFGIRSFDSVWYHLPWAASFAQTGQVTGLRFTDIEYLTAFYPATAEMFHGAGIVLLSRDTLSPILNLAWLGLVLLAAYCVGRPRGLGWLTMTGGALACAVPMFVGSQAGSAANDIVAIFFVLAAAALLNADPVEPSAFALIVGGLAAGLSIGTKLSVVIAALALTAGVVLLVRRRAWLWLGPLAAAGAFWYVRDLVSVGSPFPFLDLPGLASPAAPLQAGTGFGVSHYLFSADAWGHYFVRGFAAGLGGWWWAILAMTLAAPVLTLLPGGDARLRVLGLTALASIIAYLITPETAAGPAGQPLGFAFNLRYGAPALVLALTILPLAPILAGRRAQAGLLGVFGVVLAVTLVAPRLWPSGQLPGVLAVLAACAIVAFLAARSPPAAVAAAALIVLVAGYPLQRHYLERRYAYEPGVSSLARTWALFRGISHARVGVAGTFGGFFSYPYFGLDLSNRVAYVGVRGPHGSFGAVQSCAAWRRAVNAGRFRYLVTTPARDPWHPRPLHPAPEFRWTVSDPGAHVIYLHRVTGQPIAVFALVGSLHPDRCA